MEETTKLIITIVTSQGIVTIILQKIFEHRLNKKTFRFTKLYSDKLDEIRNLFRLLVHAEKGLEILLSRREPNDEKKKIKYYEDTIHPIDEFIKTFEENEIFFDKEIDDQITGFIHIFTNAKKTHFIANSFESDRGTEVWEIAVSKKQELGDKLKKEIPILKKKLKEEFQEQFKILTK